MERRQRSIDKHLPTANLLPFTSTVVPIPEHITDAIKGAKSERAWKAAREKKKQYLEDTLDARITAQVLNKQHQQVGSAFFSTTLSRYEAFILFFSQSKLLLSGAATVKAFPFNGSDIFTPPSLLVPDPSESGRYPKPVTIYPENLRKKTPPENCHNLTVICNPSPLVAVDVTHSCFVSFVLR